MVPRLIGLEEGKWELLWLGNLRPSTKNRSGYEVRVHFSWAGNGSKAPLFCWQPLTHLSFLRLGSIWLDGIFQGDRRAPTRQFSVSTEDAQLRAPWSPHDRSQDLFSVSDYYFQRVRELAKCWVFRTAEGERLVVPVWEVLRAWYLFCPRVMPAILAGGITHPDPIKHGLRPFLDGTGILEDGRPQLVRAQWLDDGEGKRLARLLFVPFAKEQTYQIFRHLMTSFDDSDSSSKNDGMTTIPAVLPPYEGVAPWRVRCIPLSPGADRERRWLALNLVGADLPNTFGDLVTILSNDNRQAPNRNDPSLKEVHRVSRPVSPPVGGALTLTSAGPDSSMDEVTIEGFAFDDGIVGAVQTVLIEKPEQNYRSVCMPGEPSPLIGGATDSVAISRPGHSRVRIEGTREGLSTDALFRLSVAAFRSLAMKGLSDSLEWSARLISSNALDTFPVRSTLGGDYRNFAILEFQLGGRTAYVLDAERLRAGDSFSLLLCRSTGYYRLLNSVFEDWLCKFPAQRSPWRGTGILPRNVVVEDFLHQPQRAGLLEAALQTQLENRLLLRLSKLLSG